MTSVTLDESLQGKHVINADGDDLGVITAVRNDTVYVDPDPGLADKITSMLGWDDPDGDDYPLPDGAIERVQNDEVHLRRDLTP